VQASLPTVCY